MDNLHLYDFNELNSKYGLSSGADFGHFSAPELVHLVYLQLLTVSRPCIPCDGWPPWDACRRSICFAHEQHNTQL
ncbi:hypothetical protein [Comamonas sp.]|uniref:hypothetical protein n=1 Tax=Comamonas sp. TaxID=34028 RepID=UPI0028A6574C|nr:hypothetical protein [Comamonas sp.]